MSKQLIISQISANVPVGLYAFSAKSDLFDRSILYADPSDIRDKLEKLLEIAEKHQLTVVESKLSSIVSIMKLLCHLRFTDAEKIRLADFGNHGCENATILGLTVPPPDRTSNVGPKVVKDADLDIIMTVSPNCQFFVGTGIPNTLVSPIIKEGPSLAFTEFDVPVDSQDAYLALLEFNPSFSMSFNRAYVNLNQNSDAYSKFILRFDGTITKNVIAPGNDFFQPYLGDTNGSLVYDYLLPPVAKGKFPSP